MLLEPAMIRRSFQLSGSYDVIKDITDLAGKFKVN